MALPVVIKQEQGNSNEQQSSLREQTQDALVRNVISHDYIGVVTCATCIQARGQPLTYGSLLFEIMSSGRKMIRYSRSGHICNINITEDFLRDAEIDRSVSILIGIGCVGVLECAISLQSRGIPVRTDTLYQELWVSGRLQQHGAINGDIPLQ